MSKYYFVLGVGVLRARSFLRLSLPSSSFLDTCFDFCSVVGDSAFSFASCAFLCTLYDHWSCVFSLMDFASLDFAHFMAFWVGYTCCRHSVTAHFMARWWVTHVVGFDSPFPRLALLLLFIHRHFLFCADVPVPVPFILHVDRLVRAVSAAVIPGSSGFFDTSRLFALLRLPVLLSRLFLSGADGCPHTVLVLHFHLLCFCATAADLFFGPTSCFMVILPLRILLVFSSEPLWVCD